MTRVSRSVEQWANKLAELESRNAIVKAAFYDAYNRVEYLLHEILQEEIATALEQADEFNIPAYRDPLMEVANNPEIISAYIASNRLVLELNMDEVAGTIEDYANAVDLARSNYDVKDDIDKASWYWAYVVYGDEELYGLTLEDRFAAMESLAPYWRLIDEGNVLGGASMSQGGVAYPQNGPTHFVDIAVNRMIDVLSQEVSVQGDIQMEKLSREIYGGQEVAEDITEAVATLDFDNARPYKSTPAIQEIERKSALYETYETVKGVFKNIFGRSK